MKKQPIKNGAVKPLADTALAQVRGGAFEGYVEIEFAKQGKNKGTTP